MAEGRNLKEVLRRALTPECFRDLCTKIRDFSNEFHQVLEDEGYFWPTDEMPDVDESLEELKARETAKAQEIVDRCIEQEASEEAGNADSV